MLPVTVVVGDEGREVGEVGEVGGKVLVPLADKIFLACLLGALVYWRDLPLWLLGMLFVRDAVIVLAGLWLLRARGLVVTANRWGKYTTAAMGFMSISYVLQAPDMFRNLLVAVAAAMVLVSSASYARLVQKGCCGTRRLWNDGNGRGVTGKTRDHVCRGARRGFVKN